MGMMSVHVKNVSNYTTVDIMAVSNANLYIVLFRAFIYFRVLQEGADCTIAVWVQILLSKLCGRS